MNQHKLTYLLLLFALLGSVGCEEYLDINENPNTAVIAPLDGLLANASSQTGLNQFRVGSFTGFFVQYLASPNEGSNSDTYIESDYSGTWGSIYDAMTDLYDLQVFGAERNAYHHIGVAKVMTVMNLGLLADTWGSVPFSNAFTGETITPVYDGEEAIYDTIFRLLDEAEDDLSNPANEVNIDADSDFIHAGNLDSWAKTIDALRARYLNHLSGTGNYDAGSVLSAVDGAYTSAEDDAQITKFQVRNPWAQQAVNNENLLLAGWLSEQFVDALNGTTFGVTDPRLALVATPTVNGDYVGTVNGGGRAGDGTEAIESYLSTEGALSSTNSPLEIITYAELKFIEAEAALRSGQDARALTAFEAGVTASIEKMFAILDQDGGSAASDYLQAAYPGLNVGDLTLDLIFREKYAALFLHPETWVDARRFDYQYVDFTLPENAALSEFIRRVQYPETELIRNTENTPTVTLTDRIFWNR